MATAVQCDMRYDHDPPSGELLNQASRPVKMADNEPYDGTHTIFFGYLLWLVGFTGAHRFYYGKVTTGMLWFFTLGLLGIGWLVDVVLIPRMDREARHQFAPGPTDYNVAWLLLIFAGPLGLHRLVQGKYATGLVYFLTMGLVGLGVIYDVLTLNDQIHARHFDVYQSGHHRQSARIAAASATET